MNNRRFRRLNRYMKKNKGVRYLGYLANVIYPVCLIVGFVLAANVIGLVYLSSFLLGVTWTFHSRTRTTLTMLVAVGSLIGQVVMQFRSVPDWAEWIGWIKLDSALEYAVYFGKDVLVIISSLVQLLYLAQCAKFTSSCSQLPELSHEMMTSIAAEWFILSITTYEALACVLIFVSALAVPAILSGVYYIALIVRLINWTFRVPKMTMNNIYSSSTHYFLGRTVCQIISIYCAVVLILLYVFNSFDC